MAGIQEIVAVNSNLGDKAVYHFEYNTVLSVFQKLGGKEMMAGAVV